MALRIPSPVALTKPEAYLAYKAGILSRGELKDKLLNPINNYEGWLAKWCELLETYPTNEDGTPQCLTDEEGLLAYLCGVTDRYPATNSRPDDARVSAYIRYLVSVRYARPDHPLNREEFYLSLIKPQFIPSGDPSSDIVINGTTKAPFLDVKVYGDTLQNSYSGKNLVKFAGDSGTASFGSGVTATVLSNGTIKLNGTAAGNGWLELIDPNHFLGGVATSSTILFPLNTSETYTVSFKLVSGSYSSVSSAHFTIIYTDTETTTDVPLDGSKTFTGGNGVCRGYIRVSNGNTFNNAVFSLQLEKGSTATDYEPYVGGIPAPNPEFPMPISVVTGENVAKVTGKNLFDISKVITNGTQLINNGDGTLTVNTTSSSGSARGADPATLADYCPTLAVGDTVTLSATSTGSNKFIYLGAPYSNTWAFGTTLTITQDMLGAKVFFYASGLSTTAKISNIQLELGTTATAYEPYQGQDYEVNLGKNLIDSSLVTQGGFNYRTNVEYASASTIRTPFIRCNPNSTYTVSADGALTEIAVVYAENDGSTIVEGFGYSTTNSTYTFTTPSNAHYMRVRIGGPANPRTPDSDNKWQLELGQATSYSEYFTPLELAKIGTYQDRIYKDGEKWYVEKNVGKLIADGTDGTYQNVMNGVYSFRVPTNSAVKHGTEAMSDYFHYVVYSSFYSNTKRSYGTISTHDSDDLLNIYFSAPDSSITTIAQFKTWLSTHPTTVYYALATPTTTEITNQSLIDQLNALKQGGAEEGTTYIKVSATEPNLPAKLYVEAPKYD